MGFLTYGFSEQWGFWPKTTMWQCIFFLRATRGIVRILGSSVFIAPLFSPTIQFTILREKNVQVRRWIDGFNLASCQHTIVIQSGSGLLITTGGGMWGWGGETFPQAHYTPAPCTISFPFLQTCNCSIIFCNFPSFMDISTTGPNPWNKPKNKTNKKNGEISISLNQIHV